MTSPRISVITINYNMGNVLTGTIESVLAQTYPDIEYLVIDGGSTDDSCTIIARFAPRITRWVSERDCGRYDAMNKGVAMATGEWVIFMNAGDRFQDENVVADVFRHDHSDVDLVYGDVLRRYPEDGLTRLVRAGSSDALPLQMPCSHQSLFSRRTLLLQHPFSPKFPINADHEFLLWAKGTGARFRQVDRVVAEFSKGGVSDVKRGAALKQLWRMMRAYRAVTPHVALRYAAFAARALFGLWLKRLFPAALMHWLLAHKRFD